MQRTRGRLLGIGQRRPPRSALPFVAAALTLHALGRAARRRSTGCAGDEAVSLPTAPPSTSATDRIATATATGDRRRRSPGTTVALLATAVGLAVFALTAWLTTAVSAAPPRFESPDSSATAPPATDERVAAPGPSSAPPDSGAPAPLAPAAEPAAVRIASVGIAAPLVPLGLNADRTLEVPTDVSTAGWYTGGPRPGEVGPAVIVAHVDSVDGPGAFYPLRDVRPGDTVSVDYTDGRRLVFTVTAVERHPKDRFPTRRVYGHADRPELRLITCGGSFDRATGHYDDNIVVWATRGHEQPATHRLG